MSWLSNLIKVNLDPFSTPSERLRALGPEQESQPLNVGDKAKTDAAIPILVGNQHVRLSPIQVFKRMDDAEEQVGLALVWCLGPVSNMRAYARLYANDTISTDDVFAYDPNSPDTSYLAYSHFAGAHDQVASGWQTFRDKFGWKEDCHGRGITYSLIKYFRNPDVFEQEPQFYLEVAKGNLTHIDGTSNQPDQYADNPVAWARWLLQDKTVGFAFSDNQIGESFDTLRDWIYNTRVKRYTGESGDHPRFTVNGTLAGRDTLEEKITKIEDHCFGKVVWTGEKAEFVIKGLQTQPFLYLNKDNVIGKVTKRGIAASDKLNRVVCKWVNPEKNFEEDQVCYPPVGDPLYDQWLEEDDYQEKEDTIERPLCFNAYEALKHAEVEVKESREMFEVELTVGPEGSQLTQWDVVAYTDEDRSWTDKPFLVHKIDDKKTDEAEQYVLTLLAYNPTIYEWAEQGEYVFDAPYDKSLKRYPAPGNVTWSNATRTLTWDAIPDAVISRYIVTVDGDVVARPATTKTVLSGLQLGTYEIGITAEGVYKNSHTALKTITVQTLAAPALAIEVSNFSIRIVPADSGIDNMFFELRYNRVNDLATATDGGIAKTFLIPDLAAGTEYFLWVRALYNGDESGWSITSVTTDEDNTELSEFLGLQDIIDQLDQLDPDQINQDIEELKDIKPVLQQEIQDRNELSANMLENIAANGLQQLEFATRIEAGERLIDAAVFVDPDTGEIRNRAYDFSQEKFTEAEIRLNAVENQIGLRVTSAFFNENAVTYSNVEQVLDATASYISLRATQQEIEANDVVSKANAADIFIDGSTATITSIVQSFNSDISSVNSSITDIQQQLGEDGISTQIAGLASAQQMNYENAATMLDQIAAEGLSFLEQFESDTSYALALDQVKFELDPASVVATRLETLDAATATNNQVVTAATRRIEKVETDSSGYAAALSGLQANVNTALGNASSSLTLASQIDSSLDDLRASALLAVDAQGNTSLIQLDATPSVSLIKFVAGLYAFTDTQGNTKIGWNSNSGMYEFVGDIIASSFRTSTGTGFRMELFRGDYILWAGSGTMNDDNAVAFIRKNGVCYFSRDFIKDPLTEERFGRASAITATASGHASKGNNVKITASVAMRLRMSTADKLTTEPTALAYRIKRNSTIIDNGTLYCSRFEIDPGGEPGVNWITIDNVNGSIEFVDTANSVATYGYTIEVDDYSAAGTTTYNLSISTKENLTG